MAQKISIDVMKGDSYYKTLMYDYNPPFRFDNRELERCLRFVNDRFPSLRTAKDATLFLRFPDSREEQMIILDNN